MRRFHFLRRSAILALAGFYLLASTNLAWIALHRMTTETEPAAVTDFPCAGHECGCKTAEICRTHCCCFPAAQKPQARVLPASPETEGLLLKAQCSSRGAEGDSVQTKPLGPQYLPASKAQLDPPPKMSTTAHNRSTPNRVFPDPPDKVPI